MLNDIIKNLLAEVSGIPDIPLAGAFNIRNNGQSEGRNSTENIQIVPKENGSGIDIYIKPGTKDESVHIPALITEAGMHDLVYNDFHIGEGADVTIVAGCGIHNCGSEESLHEGIHRFFVGKDAKIKYIEKHIGEGDGNGKRIINPQTHIEAEENSYIEMDTVQLKGVDSTKRVSSAKLAAGATLVIKEKIMTQIAKDLSLSKATCTRAINDLTVSGLVTQNVEGTHKWINPAYGKPEFLKKGYERLKSPVERILYMKTPVQVEKQVISGLRALAQQSIIGVNEQDGAIAVSKKTAAKIPVDAICTEQYFGDFGGSVVEVWSYDPAILARNACVDDISLLLSMDKDPSERIQMCLDEIREKHELPIKEEE